MLVFSYMPYLLAASLRMSGIMAIFVAGIIMSHYTQWNLSGRRYMHFPSPLLAFPTDSPVDSFPCFCTGFSSKLSINNCQNGVPVSVVDNVCPPASPVSEPVRACRRGQDGHLVDVPHPGVCCRDIPLCLHRALGRYRRLLEQHRPRPLGAPARHGESPPPCIPRLLAAPFRRAVLYFDFVCMHAF